MKDKAAYIFRSLSTKVILLIMVLVLPLNILAIIEANASIETVIEQTRLMEQNVADSYMGEVQARMENTRSLLYYILTEDTNCLTMKAQTEENYEYQNAKLKCFYNLRHMAGLISGSEGYFFYMKKLDDMLIYSSEGSVRHEIVEEIVQENLQQKGAAGWNIYEWDGQQYLFLIVELKDIMYGGWINLANISSQLQRGLQYQECIVSFSDSREAVTKEWIGISSQGKNVVLNVRISKREILQGIAGYHRFLQVITVVYLALVPLLYLILYRLLLLPLQQVNKAHHQLRSGNPDYRITERSTSVEYDEVFHSFNEMADNLNALKIEAYEKEIDRQKMELRNLQLQIRPHFLLNTFNLVFTLAQKRANDAIQKVIIYLSDYFRYLFRSEKELQLFHKEQHLLEGYAQMAAMRYPNQIEITYEFDPEIMFIRIPPLLILNFVENSVKYGIRKGKVLHINVWGHYERDRVTFHIIDDGIGMSAEILQRNQMIFSGELEMEQANKHIGLYNSLKRLKYFYGPEAEIAVGSEPDVETIFKIEFPYVLEVDDETLNGK